MFDPDEAKVVLCEGVDCAWCSAGAENAWTEIRSISVLLHVVGKDETPDEVALRVFLLRDIRGNTLGTFLDGLNRDEAVLLDRALDELSARMEWEPIHDWSDA